MAPIIRCTRARGWGDTFVYHTVRTTTTKFLKRNLSVVLLLFWDASKEEILYRCLVERHPLSLGRSRKSVRWRALELTDDDLVAAHLTLVFASEELLVQFKDACEAAQAACLTFDGRVVRGHGLGIPLPIAECHVVVGRISSTSSRGIPGRARAFRTLKTGHFSAYP